jgi:hypothetical protein
LPASVFGPVLKPPWLGQRPFSMAWRLQGWPARVRAEHEGRPG